MVPKLSNLVCALIVIFVPASAYAYIDPGTGSILIQGLIAAIAAIGVTLKLYWHRFKALFRRGSSSKEDVAEPQSDRKSDLLE